MQQAHPPVSHNFNPISTPIFNTQPNPIYQPSQTQNPILQPYYPQSGTQQAPKKQLAIKYEASPFSLEKTQQKNNLSGQKQGEIDIREKILGEQVQPKRRHSINIDQNAQEQPYFQTGGFQVVVHKVDSRQSISQNGEQKYCIDFTKSEINIPIEFIGDQQEGKNQPDHLNTQSNNLPLKSPQDSDFYIQRLQQKSVNKQQQESQIINLINSLEIDYQKNKSLQNNILPTKQLQTNKSNHVAAVKNAHFKVKEINDRNHSSTANVKDIRTSNQLKMMKSSQNHSEMLSAKSSELKIPLHFIRSNKKHVSNFQSVDKSLSKNSNTNQQQQNVQYQISLNKSVQKMSHILQDRCYNSFKSKKQTLNPKETQNHKQQSLSKVRKIIKRSPYGFLQIQVKYKKNNSKITNLRILKPKQMIRLKKVPNIGKVNKQNFLQKGGVTILYKNVHSRSLKENNPAERPLNIIN